MTDYTFTLSSGNDSRTASPIWNNDLSLTWHKGDAEEYFRRELQGDLIFAGDDYTFISGKSFDAEFILVITYQGAEYWRGSFHKTDGEFDADAKTFKVTPSVVDDYVGILGMLEKEYNLAELPVACDNVTYDVRPVYQIMVATGRQLTEASASASVVSSIIGDVAHNKSVDAVSLYDLINTYHFGKLLDSGSFTFCCVFNFPEMRTDIGSFVWLGAFGGTKTIGGHTWKCDRDSNGFLEVYMDGSSTPVYFSAVMAQSASTTITLYATSAAQALGFYTRIDVPIWSFQVLGRVLSASDPGSWTAISNDSLNPYNYGYCREGTVWDDMVWVQHTSQATATKYGKTSYNEDLYYSGVPAVAGAYQPVCRDSWFLYSVWCPINGVFSFFGSQYNTARELKNAYSLQGVIQALLDAGGAGLEFSADSSCSQFFYGSSRPIIGVNLDFYLTQKTNIKKTTYTRAAQNIPLTLRKLLDSLRKMFRVYWFVEDGKLRLEHVYYFMHGGSYTQSPAVGLNLLTMTCKNGKSWAFGQNSYKYNKQDMPERYEFAWMDDVSSLFTGSPIDLLSGYAEAGQVESITVDNITTDIDFIFGYDSGISDDGLVFLAAQLSSGVEKVAYYIHEKDDLYYRLQNGYLSFAFLQSLYLWDLPCSSYAIDGVSGTAYGIKKNKVQTIVCPAGTSDPDENNLIRTGLGDGKIESMTISLSSRRLEAELSYDTE